MYERIVVPLDGSELAEIPLQYVHELASRCASELTLFHVCGTAECVWTLDGYRVQPMHKVYVEHTAEVVARRLQEAGARGTRVNFALGAGDPASEILRHVEENDANLVVMATHGRSGVSRWVLGSVAARVVSHCHAPVRLVRSLRPGEAPPSDWPETKILVPLDGSEIAEQVLPYVIQHAKMSDSEVTLLRVGEAPVISSDYPEAAMHLSWEEHVARMTERYEEESHLYLQGVEKRLTDAGLNVRSDSVLGIAAREIIDYAGTNDFNLIAMTCHARFVIGAWPIGSVADKVIHGSSTPVLVVRPR